MTENNLQTSWESLSHEEKNHELYLNCTGIGWTANWLINSPKQEADLSSATLPYTDRDSGRQDSGTSPVTFRKRYQRNGTGGGTSCACINRALSN